MQILPFIPSTPDYTFTTTIIDSDASQNDYRFDVWWSAVENAWYFDARELDGTLIAGGLKIVIGTYIGRTVNHPLFRKGVIIANDLSTRDGSGPDAGFDDIGTRVIVMRVPLDELNFTLSQAS